MRLPLIILFAILSFTIESNGQTDFNTSPTGLKYKMFTHENGPKPKLGDVIKFNFILYAPKDSVLSSTYKSLFPVVTEIRPPSYPGDLEEAFMMMSKGDSAMFLVSADSFYNGQVMPVPAGAMLKMRIKMLDIESPAEYAVERQKQNEEQLKISEQLKIQETKNLDIYIKNKAPNALETPDGMYYVIENKGTGPFPKDSQTIIIRYTCYLLNARAIDGESDKVTSFVLGRHEVIRGWEKGVALLNKGSKARLYIPSSLAYGARGQGSIIHPYTTLIYDMEVLEIK